jgi:hypothetical protein
MSEILKYLYYDKYIDGMKVLGRDILIFSIDNVEYEVTQKQLNLITERVYLKLKKYNFFFLSNDKSSIYTIPEYIINYAKKTSI